MQQAKGEKRGYPRWPIGGRLAGRIDAAHNVSFIDISLGGILIEHADIIRPGGTSLLTLLVLGREITLNCRVMRSLVHRPDVEGGGERRLIYRTGLQFLGPSEESLRLIDEYIEFLKGQQPDTRPEARS
ncbi:MAG: PilZ domain-containing protein [candidate division NC10 bacterium]